MIVSPTWARAISRRTQRAQRTSGLVAGGGAPAAAGCRGFAARGQEGSRGGLQSSPDFGIVGNAVPGSVRIAEPPKEKIRSGCSSHVERRKSVEAKGRLVDGHDGDLVVDIQRGNAAFPNQIPIPFRRPLPGIVGPTDRERRPREPLWRTVCRRTSHCSIVGHEFERFESGSAARFGLGTPSAGKIGWNERPVPVVIVRHANGGIERRRQHAKNDDDQNDRKRKPKQKCGDGEGCSFHCGQGRGQC